MLSQVGPGNHVGLLDGGARLVPPGKYIVIISVWWRCNLMSNYFDHLLWPANIFLPCGLFLSPYFFLSSPNLSGRRLDVYHTSTHGVALVRI